MENYYRLEIDYEGLGSYSVEFGDFDLEVVLQEIEDEFKNELWRIVKTKGKRI